MRVQGGWVTGPGWQPWVESRGRLSCHGGRGWCQGALGELLLVLHKPLGTWRVSQQKDLQRTSALGFSGKCSKCRGPTRFPAAAPGTSRCVPLRRSPPAPTWSTPWRRWCPSRRVGASKTQAGWLAGTLAGGGWGKRQEQWATLQSAAPPPGSCGSEPRNWAVLFLGSPDHTWVAAQGSKPRLLVGHCV